MYSSISVIIVASDQAQRKLLRKQLATLNDIEVLGEYDDIKQCQGLLQAGEPDVLMVELDGSGDWAKTLELVESTKLAQPTISVFVNSSSSAPELIMSAMRAGVQEFLSRPIDPQELQKAFAKVQRQKRHAEPQAGAGGQIISVFSKRGGLGVTTLAVNLGIALAEVSEERTALVDLDLQLGDISSFLDLSPDYDILDACGSGGKVDATTLQSCMTPHNSGVAVLAEPKTPGDSGAVSDDHVRQILGHLKTTYRYVVVDASHTFNAITHSAFEQSDSILVVTESTVPSTRATKHSLDLFRALGYGPEKVQIVLNRKSKSDGIQVSEIERTLDYPIFWTIPNNYRAAIDAINTGVPLVNGKRPSNVGKSVLQLAEALMNGRPGRAK